MPSLPKKNNFTRSAPKSERKPTSDQKFYHSQRWKDARKVHLQYHPVCEVHQYLGKLIDCTQREPIDHIIRIDAGGSPLDFRNLMTLCTKCHSVKTGLEKKEGFIVERQGTEGEYYVSQQEKERIVKKIAKYVN